MVLGFLLTGWQRKRALLLANVYQNKYLELIPSLVFKTHSERNVF